MQHEPQHDVDRSTASAAPSVVIPVAGEAIVRDRPRAHTPDAVARHVAGAPGSREHLQDGPRLPGRSEDARVLHSREVGATVSDLEEVRFAGEYDAGRRFVWDRALQHARDSHLLRHVVRQDGVHRFHPLQRRRQ